MIKDGKQAAYGNYQEIISTGFDIEEILKSYNQQLKDGKKSTTTEGYSPEKAKEKTAERKKEVDTRDKKGSGDLLVAEDKDQGGIKLADIRNYLSYSFGNFGFVLFFIFQTACALC